MRSIDEGYVQVASLNYNNDQIGQQNDGSSRGKGLFFDLYGSNADASAMTAWVWGVSRIIDALEHGLEELVVGLDVDLDQLQGHALGHALDDGAGVVAQVAAGAAVERDHGHLAVRMVGSAAGWFGAQARTRNVSPRRVPAGSV